MMLVEIGFDNGWVYRVRFSMTPGKWLFCQWVSATQAPVSLVICLHGLNVQRLGVRNCCQN